MRTTYLLPCSCGKKIPVDGAQAGESVVCSCGQAVEVPTLLKLKQLETIAEKPETGHSAWGVQQQVMFVGLVIVAVGLGLMAKTWSLRFRPPNEEVLAERIAEDTARLTLLQSYQRWESLRRDMRQWMAAEEHFQAATARFRLWLAASVTVLVGGLVVLVVAFFIRPARPSRDEPMDAEMDGIP